MHTLSDGTGRSATAPLMGAESKCVDILRNWYSPRPLLFPSCDRKDLTNSIESLV